MLLKRSLLKVKNNKCDIRIKDRNMKEIIFLSFLLRKENHTLRVEILLVTHQMYNNKTMRKSFVFY